MGKEDYLSAKEAHEISVSVSHIEEVMDKIRSSCKKGYFRALFTEIAEVDVGTLRGLGYKVDHNRDFYHVSW